MPLPQPTDVANCAARSWTPAFAQHALLFLSGIVSSLRNAAAFDTVNGSRFGEKATELEIVVGDLARVIREHPIDVPGGALSTQLCLLLACETEAQLAEVLTVPLSIVLAGRARMYALAERMVAAGRPEGVPLPAGAPQPPPVVGPSPTVLGG